VCDNTYATVGDACDEPGDYACSVDHASALACKDFKFVVEETCRGARACKEMKDGLYCDNDLSEAGDPCHTNGDYACTPDKTMALRCVDHKMAPLNSCRGAKGCRVFELPEEKKTEFVCSDELAQENDPCDENGEEACTMDKKALLKCASNKFAAHKTCAGPGGCSFDPKGDKFACDEGSVAAAGKGATADPKKTTATHKK
jgi:hypothetical protein